MARYTLEEIAHIVGKNSDVVKQWFEKLADNLDYRISSQNGQMNFDEEDLQIASYIAEKREGKWSYDDIVLKVKEKFPPSKETPLVDPNLDFSNWKKDPESLFYDVAQDNEVIKIFKYHSIRVMFLASALAKRVGCYDEEMRVAALLHDIGKIGISKHILLKKEKLTDLEYTLIQSHSHVGNTIVRKHFGLIHAATFIRDHHERWDGKGYPRGLKGEEISIQGRIISICDAFDTMTVDRRTYKNNPFSYEKAFQELERCAWSQFDGSLVDKFIKMMDEVKVPDYMM